MSQVHCSSSSFDRRLCKFIPFSKRNLLTDLELKPFLLGNLSPHLGVCFSLSYYKILNVLSTEVVHVWKSDCAVNTNFPKISKRHFGTRLKEYQKAVFCGKKENSALSEHTCLTNHTSGWDNSKLITTNRRYH